MRKLLKVLIVADILIFALGVVFYLGTQNSNSDWGYAVGFPILGVTILTVAILVFSFGSAMKNSVASRNVSNVQLFASLITLPGVPLLGLWYSTSGDNRAGLKVASITALGLAVVALIFMFARNLKLK